MLPWKLSCRHGNYYVAIDIIMLPWESAQLSVYTSHLRAVAKNEIFQGLQFQGKLTDAITRHVETSEQSGEKVVNALSK
jgi:hypothetical protein